MKNNEIKKAFINEVYGGSRVKYLKDYWFHLSVIMFKWNMFLYDLYTKGRIRRSQYDTASLF